MKPSVKAVLITGANRGLGLSLAKRFAAGGYNLLLHCRSGWLDLAACFSKCIVIDGDLREQAVVNRLAQAATEASVDILINNAGVYLSRPFGEMIGEEIREVIETNLLAPIFLTRAIWHIFTKKKSGLVININSLASHSPKMGESAYAASKAGLNGFSNGLQFDGTPAGTLVLNVCLGAMKTEMMKDHPDYDYLIDPAEVAAVVFTLCQEYNSLRITSVDIRRRIYK